MKKLYFLVVLVAAMSTVLVSSCQSSSADDAEATVMPSDEKVIGTDVFVSAVRDIQSFDFARRSSDPDDVDVTDKTVQKLIDASLVYLEANDLDLSDFFESEDPRIAIVAMVLADADRVSQNNQVSRTSVGGCVLEGLGVRGLGLSMGKKALAKAACKVLLKRAIPYVGWGLFAIDFANCIAASLSR